MSEVKERNLLKAAVSSSELGARLSNYLELERSDQPLLIIVNGRPCTGKSYLASVISESLRIPLFSKDEIKEQLGEVVGVANRAASKRLGIAAITLMYQQARIVLKAGLPTIIESPLLPDLAAREIETLQIQTGSRILQIFLQAEPFVILRRFRVRARGGLHFHDESMRELEAAVQTELIPVAVRGKTVVVDTTDFNSVNYAEIVEQVRNAYHCSG